MKYSNKWEEVSERFYRLNVPGGWLVRDIDYDETSVTTALCFLPDPSYSWELKYDEHA